MRPLASAPPAAPIPRRPEAEAFWNSFSCDHSIAVLQSVPAFLLQTPGGAPAALAQVARSRTLPCRVGEPGLAARRPVPVLGLDANNATGNWSRPTESVDKQPGARENALELIDTIVVKNLAACSYLA